MKRIISLMLAVALYCCANAELVGTTRNVVNLRSKPSTTAPVVGSLEKTDLLPCTDKLDGWYEVEIDGKKAYVSSSVSFICGDIVPKEMLNKSLMSTGPIDKTRFEGSLDFTKLNDRYVVISVTWMRTNLPADTWTYLAEYRNGHLSATYSLPPFVDTDQKIDQIIAEGEKLSTPIPVGYDKLKNTIYFIGIFSE